MTVTVDANLLVRTIVQDDPVQAAAATRAIKQAEKIIVPLPCLCEVAWVLAKVYRLDQADIAHALRALLAVEKVVTDRAAADIGIDTLEAGGDFADGVIAAQGFAMGGETFVTFDKRAARILKASGFQTEVLQTRHTN